MRVLTIQLVESTGPFQGLFSSSPYAVHLAEENPSFPALNEAQPRLKSVSWSSRLNFWPWGGASSSASGGGECVLDNRDGALNATFAGVAECAFNVREGDDTQPFSEHTVIAVGICGDIETNSRELRVRLRPHLEVFDYSLNRTFISTTDSQNEWYPVGLGHVLYARTWQPFSSSFFQVSDSQDVSITAVWADGVSIGYTSATYGFTATPAANAQVSADALFQRFGGGGLDTLSEVVTFAFVDRFVGIYTHTPSADIATISASVGDLAWSSTGEEVKAFWLLDTAAVACCGAWFVKRPPVIADAQLSIIQLDDPASGTPLATLDMDSIKGGLAVVIDKAEALTLKMECEHSPGAYKSDPKDGLGLYVAESSVMPHGIYAKAENRKPVTSFLADHHAAVTELERVATLYGVPRFKIETKFLCNLLPDWVQCGSVVEVVHPDFNSGDARNALLYGFRTEYVVSARGYSRDIFLNLWA